MSDTPEPQIPSQSDGTVPPVDPTDNLTPDGSNPEPTSEAPEGLTPSPGIAPPAGIQPPVSSTHNAQVPGQPGTAPQFQPPQFGPPQYQSPQFGPPQYQSPQFGAPQNQPAQGVNAGGQPQVPGTQDPGFVGAPYTAGQPGQPGQFDPSQPTPPKKGLSTGAIIGIVAGAVVLMLLIAAGVFAVSSLLNRGSGSSPVATGASASSAPQAVEEYLTALSEGDAKTARAFVGGTASDTLLTDEVLAESNEIAPLANIVVDEEVVGESDYEAVVTATFDLGEESVTRDFRVWNYSDDWEIYDGVVNISLTQFDGLDVSVNDVEPGDDYARAFIGAYQFELGVDEFELGGDTDTFVFATDDDASSFYEIQPVLTQEAVQTYRDLVRASLTECVALTSLATPCGLDVTGPLSDGAMPIDGTVQRTLTAEGDAALNKLKPEPSYDSPTVVSSYDYIQVNTTLEADKDGERMSGELLFGGNLLKPFVDFAKENPKVTWQ